MNRRSFLARSGLAFGASALPATSGLARHTLPEDLSTWTAVRDQFEFTRDWISPWGDIFIRLLKLIAIPLVLSFLPGVPPHGYGLGLIVLLPLWAWKRPAHRPRWSPSRHRLKTT